MQIRPAQPADALAVAQVHVRSWQVAYRDLLPASFLAQLSPEVQAARYTFADKDPAAPHTLLAVEDDQILGFASTMPARDPGFQDHGELCALYVDPVHWNRGLGAALIVEARAHLAATGFRRAILWILAGNTRADRFYRLDGWLPDGAEKTEPFRDITLNEIRYQRDL